MSSSDKKSDHGISGFLKESMMERSDKFTVKINETNGLISNDEESEDIVSVDMPYAMKMLLQELQTMSIAPRLITNDSVNNPMVHEYIEENFN